MLGGVGKQHSALFCTVGVLHFTASQVSRLVKRKFMGFTLDLLVLVRQNISTGFL